MQILFNSIREGQKPNKELANGLKVFEEDIHRADTVDVGMSASGGLQIEATNEDEFGHVSKYVIILEKTDIMYLKENGLI